MKTKDAIYAFCENVRRLRRKSNLTKTEMAKKLDISLYSLSLIEKNILPERLSASIIIKIYSEFKILPKDLFILK